MIYDVAGTLTHEKDQPLSEREKRTYQFLQSHPVGVLSTLTPEGEPHGSVIYFTVDTSFHVGFLTRKLTRKYTNLLHNQHAMLTVFDPESQTVGQVIGTAKEIFHRRGINRITKAIMAASAATSQAGLPPIAKLENSPYTAFTIIPRQVHLASYGSPHDTGAHEILESG